MTIKRFSLACRPSNKHDSTEQTDWRASHVETHSTEAWAARKIRFMNVLKLGLKLELKLELRLTLPKYIELFVELKQCN